MVKGAKALELWCQRASSGYPGVNVTNMTSSWRDGLAFCAIIHRYRPDLIDFGKLDKKDVKGNCERVFRIAEEKLGIPHLLDAEDMASCTTPDRLSILTYVSEYYHKFKSANPKGTPHNLSKVEPVVPMEPLPRSIPSVLKRQDSTDSSGMPLSRTPSSSGVSSNSSNNQSSASSVNSCESSNSSVCDSPPPLNKVEEKKQEQEQTVVKSKAIPTTETNGFEQQQQLQPERHSEETTKVVLRRKRERSLASRRMVQSMFLESTGGITALVRSSSTSGDGDDGGCTSPDIERENPFREAMMKFASMENDRHVKKEGEMTKRKISSESQQQQEQTEEQQQQQERKTSCSKSTETPSPSHDNKSTQTIGIMRKSRNPNSPFKSVLKSQVSCPTGSSSNLMSRSTINCSKLSYTSTPRPYLKGQINRSFSLGQSLNKMTLAPSHSVSCSLNEASASVVGHTTATEDSHLMTQSFSGSLPIEQQQSKTLSSPSSAQQKNPVVRSNNKERRGHQRNQSIGMRSMFTDVIGQSIPYPHSPAQHQQSQQRPQQQQQPPLIWHTSPYTSTPSIYSSLVQQPQSDSFYCGNNNNNKLQSYQPNYRELLTHHVPKSQSKNERHLVGLYNHDRLKLHIEGQSSLV